MYWFKLFLLKARISFEQMLIYRLASVMFLIFGSLIIFAEYLAIDVYFNLEPLIGGWSRSAFFILFGSFNCMLQLYLLFFEIGHDDFAFKVRYGELDYDLIRPVDTMFLCSFSRFDYPSLLNLALPIFLIYKGVEGENISLGFLNTSMFLLAIGLGTVVIYLLNHILMTLTFWVKNFSSAFQLIGAVVSLGSKPLNLYPWVLQIIFGFCLPIILAGNMPAKVLLQDFSYAEVFALIVGTITLYVLTRILWNKGIRKYSSASS